jgi:cobalamin biosynthesis protein CobD/CbiB
MSNKKRSPEDSLAGYSRKMQQATKKLGLAAAYADDGAQLTAARYAAEAITLLITAHAQRCTAHYLRDGSGNGAQLKCPSTRSRALLAISTSTTLPTPTQKLLPSNTPASPATL